MIFLSKMPKSLILGTLLLALVSCSSKPVVQEFPITASASEEIQNLERDLNSARTTQVNALSPKNFDEAVESLDDAKKMYSKGKDQRAILEEVALGRAYLDNANRVSEVARNNIEAVVEARQSALDAGAPTYFSRDWKRVDEDFTDLTEDIEKNKMAKIPKERTELQRRYLDLELRSIKEKNLKESRDMLAQAKKNRAQKFAPTSYAIAEKSIADTDAYITANKYNTVEIEARVAETKKLVEKAVKINAMAQTSKNLSTEELALKYDEEQTRLAKTSSKLDKVEDRLSLTQSALEKEKTSNSYLAAQKRLQDKYVEAQKHFSKDEAEVYKQGDALLIRLKGMNFPTAKSNIKDSSKPLLSKVQEVIQDFGSSSVIIEGHTDSTGSSDANYKLSQARAESVKNFLQSNSSDITSIQAEGLGYQKPIATNKTASGRAQNRRVDIIIKPEMSSVE